jgi:hypothetical protein
MLIDSTNTFEIDKKFNLILKKYLNIKQQQYYQLILKEIETNQTEQVRQCLFNADKFCNNFLQFGIKILGKKLSAPEIKKG